MAQRENTDRIAIFADGKETLLCDWTDFVQEGADVSPQSQVQVVQYFRGSEAAAFDRGNQSVTLNFIVNREFTDEVKAFNAWVNCQAVTPRSGNLIWRTRNGRSQLTRYLVNCVVQVKPVRRMGAAVWMQYTCIGGSITTTPPVT